MKTLFFSVLLVSDLGMGLALAEPFPVNTTADSGPGTLRQAILDSNSTPGPNLINFNIPGGGVHVIHVLSALPTITQPVVIDGRTQPGYLGAPLIDIDGASTPSPTEGLIIEANGCEIYGLAIHSFPSSVFFFAAAVHVIGSGGVIIRDSYMGLDAAGGFTPGAQLCGLHIENSWSSEIGGPGFGGNVISGNYVLGVWIQGFSATNNVVEGNLIGTDISGAHAHPNGLGVHLVWGDRNRIGGLAAESRNIISGNTSNGVYIVGSCLNLVQGNYIGTDRSGTVAVPNLVVGVQLSSDDVACNSNQIVGNVISGNDSDGVRLVPKISCFSPINYNLISGNSIGTGINGAALGNDKGIALLTSCTMQNVAASNIIAHNLYDGVYLSGTSNYIGTANSIHDNGHNGVTVVTNGVSSGLCDSIRSNSIYSNGAIGIDLGNDGPTSNDRLDGDWGANNLQNFPVVTNALHSWGFVTVSGMLNSEANKNYTLDFFWNICRIVCPCNCEKGGYYIGSLAVTTDQNGNVLFNTTFAAQVPPGLGVNPCYITATATDPEGNTSEFSDCCLVQEYFAAHVFGGNLVVSWPYSECTLQSSPQLSPPSWSDVPATVTCEEGECRVTLPATANAMFFRLRCP